MSSRVDLHIHTTASDGQFSPTEIVHKALEIGLSAIAITDHDTTAGVAEGLEAAKDSGLEVIPGVEISTDASGPEAHVLGYYVSHDDPGLCKTLELFRDSRLERAQTMLAKLARMGLRLDWDRVREIAGVAAVGRPHIAQAMLERGYVSSIEQAFDVYIGQNRPAYAGRYRLPPAEAVETILAADGLPVLAHPLQVTHLIPALARCGLVGLEAYYPGYTPDETRFLLDLADEHHLVPTGGSDFHGGNVLPANQLGAVTVEREAVAQLHVRHRHPNPQPQR